MGFRHALGAATLAFGLAATPGQAQSPLHTNELTAYTANGLLAFVASIEGLSQPGACLSHGALIAAHPQLRAEGVVFSGSCKDAGSGRQIYAYECNANAPGAAAAADRLFVAGRQLYLEKKPVTLNAEDISAVCQQIGSGPSIAPAVTLTP
jgi:hypothetical protein